ncbi:MAG: hypothetical protein N3B13_00455 [Deltaproteobacteria bacterium]|nr:hypothetical protein [Deltaproteobacteria bacterium]
MKKVITFSVIVLSLLLLVSACKKNEVKQSEPQAKAKQEETQKALGQEGKPAVNADENCSKTYDFMKAFVEQMEQQMAKMGKKPPNRKDFPSKEKFVKACKELPTDIIRCLDMEYSMKNQQECQDAKKNADPEKMKKFEEMLK